MVTKKDAERARTLQTYDRRDIRSLANYIRPRFGPEWRELYRLLEDRPELVERLKGLTGPEKYSALDRVALTGNAMTQKGIILLMMELYYRTILDREALPLYIPRGIEPADVVDDALMLKRNESTVLRPFIGRFNLLARPDWARQVTSVRDKAEKRIAELEELKVALWRMHLAHMWYVGAGARGHPRRVTPDPFAMVSVFVITRTPYKWTWKDLETALNYLESAPEAFCTFTYRSKRKPAHRGKPGVPENYSSFFLVVGKEKRKIDPDIVEDWREKIGGMVKVLDTIFYYVIFYHLDREYWGVLASPRGPIKPLGPVGGYAITRPRDELPFLDALYETLKGGV